MEDKVSHVSIKSIAKFLQNLLKQLYSRLSTLDDTSCN